MRNRQAGEVSLASILWIVLLIVLIIFIFNRL